MARMLKRALLIVCACALLCLGLAACGAQPTTKPEAQVYSYSRCLLEHETPIATIPSPANQPTLYVSAFDGDLYAVDPASGAIRWCVQFSDPVNPIYAQSPGGSRPPPIPVNIGKLIVAGDTLYACVSGMFHFTYALNAMDGTVRWRQATDCGMAGLPFVDTALPILANGLLYSGSYALNASDGAVQWKLPQNAAVISACANGMVYAYTASAVSAWDAQTGAPRWRYALPDRVGAPLTVADGVVYAGAISNANNLAFTAQSAGLYALDADTGKLLWRAPVGDASSAAVVAGGVVYVGGATHAGGVGPALFAVDAATGAIRWRATTISASTVPISSPIPAGSLVYFAADDIYAVDATTGARRWRRSLSVETHFARASDTTLARGVLYVGWNDSATDDALYALSASDGATLWAQDELNQLDALAAT